MKRHFSNKMDCELVVITGDILSSEPKVQVIESFQADSYEDAANHVKAYREKAGNDGRNYYYREIRKPYGVWHEDGIVSFGQDEITEYYIGKIANIRQDLKKITDKELRKPLIRKVAILRKHSNSKFFRFWVSTRIKVWNFVEFYFWDKPKGILNDIRFNGKRNRYFKKNHHDIQEIWSLHEHMLSDLKWNLNRLIVERHGISMEFEKESAKEYAIANGKDASDDKLHEYYDIPEVIEVAEKKQNATYERIIHLIDLYCYYGFTSLPGYEDDEVTTPDMIEIHQECSYNIVDYKKMSDKAQECWNEIWELFKKHGQGMWD